MAYQCVKGTYDLLPEDLYYFEKVETLFRHFMNLYGYREIKTPVFEFTGVFAKENDTSDMVTKEMYSFSPNGKDSYTLRPEGTAGVIRSFVEKKMHGSNELPVKLAYIEEMFRHERPQKGRQRQFTQMGVENIGEKNPMIDAETIALGYFYVRTLGLSQIEVRINTLGDADSRIAYKNKLIEYFSQYKEELCFDCQNRLEKNPLRILDCKVDHHLDIIKNAPKMADYLTPVAKEYYKKVLGYLDAMGIPYKIDDTLVRGLDYYTDTVFEVVSLNPESGSQSTIFGGGRYDSLVKEMGGPEISGMGFAIGVERLIILAKAEGVFDEYKPSTDVYVIDMTKGSDYALEVATILRNNSYATELNYYDRSMKAQFKSSERKNARFVAIIGEDEMNNGTIALKDTKDRSQRIVKLDELIDCLDSILEEENV
ncbi:MAG: histidine--tRNA ligase [Erysipelotrichaceae bacterium]|nr:histidine--tRNA ligase [Erysipelotrichaceae bacterium]